MAQKVYYHEINDQQFEELVIEFCSELFGDGIQGFVTGPDGGRDASFDGTASKYPSSNDLWKGKTVIQAKHTELLSKSFSDNDFYSKKSKSCQVLKEIEKIKALKKVNAIDNYMLVANRRLSGTKDLEIKKLISSKTSIPESNIRLVDESELDRWCKRYPNCIDRVDLNPAKTNFEYDPEDLAEVITKISENKSELSTLPDVPQKYILPKDKNRENGLSPTYFKEHIQRYYKDFDTIKDFLAHPDNAEATRFYDEASSELAAKLCAWNTDDIEYEKVLEKVFEKLFNRDADLKQNKNLTRAVIYFMYYHCDVGSESSNA